MDDFVETDLSKIDRLLDKIEKDTKKQQTDDIYIESEKFTKFINETLQLYSLTLGEVTGTLELLGLSQYSEILVKLFNGVQNQALSVLRFGLYHSKQREKLRAEMQQKIDLENQRLFTDQQRSHPNFHYDFSSYARFLGENSRQSSKESSPTSSQILEGRTAFETSPSHYTKTQERQVPSNSNFKITLADNAQKISIQNFPDKLYASLPDQTNQIVPSRINSIYNKSSNLTRFRSLINDQMNDDFGQDIIMQEENERNFKEYLQGKDQIEREIEDFLKGKDIVEHINPTSKVSAYLKQALKELESTKKKVNVIAQSTTSFDEDVEDPKFEEMGSRIRKAFKEAKIKAIHNFEVMMKSSQSFKEKPVRNLKNNKKVTSVKPQVVKKDAFTMPDFSVLDQEKSTQKRLREYEQEIEELKTKIYLLDQEKIHEQNKFNLLSAEYSACLLENGSLRQTLSRLENELIVIKEVMQNRKESLNLNEKEIYNESIEAPIHAIDEQNREISQIAKYSVVEQKSLKAIEDDKSQIENEGNSENIILEVEEPKENNIILPNPQDTIKDCDSSLPLNDLINLKENNDETNIDFINETSIDHINNPNNHQSETNSKNTQDLLKTEPSDEKVQIKPSNDIPLIKPPSVAKIIENTENKNKSNPQLYLPLNGSIHIVATEKHNDQNEKKSIQANNNNALAKTEVKTHRRAKTDLESLVYVKEKMENSKNISMLENKFNPLQNKISDKVAKNLQDTVSLKQHETKAHTYTPSFEEYKNLKTQKIQQNPLLKNQGQVFSQTSQSLSNSKERKELKADQLGYKSQSGINSKLLNESIREKTKDEVENHELNKSTILPKVLESKAEKNVLDHFENGIKIKANLELIGGNIEDNKEKFPIGSQSARFTGFNHSNTAQSYNPFTKNLWGKKRKSAELEDILTIKSTFNPQNGQKEDLNNVDNIRKELEMKKTRKIDLSKFDVNSPVGIKSIKKPGEEIRHSRNFSLFAGEILQIKNIQSPVSYRENYARTQITFNEKEKGFQSYIDFPDMHPQNLATIQSPFRSKVEDLTNMADNRFTQYCQTFQQTKVKSTIDECIMQEILKERDEPSASKEEVQLRTMYRSMLCKAKQQPKLVSYMRKLAQEITKNKTFDNHPAIDFESFEKIVKSLIEQHNKCGENCIHIKNFYLKIGYQTLWNNRAPFMVKRADIGYSTTDIEKHSPRLPVLTKKKKELGKEV